MVSEELNELFGDITVFEVIRGILLWVSPVILIIGLFLIVTADRYSKLEEKLGKEVGGIRKRVLPKLESNIYTFHQWLLKRNVVVGAFYILCAVLFFVSSRGPNPR